jgi:PqqD family protein of HPr-rel-A system
MPDDRPIRNADVEVNEVSDGYVVYDAGRDRVHYLNRTATLVLEFCTGENTAEEIVAVLQNAYDLPEPPEAETKACLEQLRAEGLIQ